MNRAYAYEPGWAETPGPKSGLGQDIERPRDRLRAALTGVLRSF